MPNQDIFDRIMSSRLLRFAYPFYRRNKEMLLYLFFGGLSFLVSIGSFIFFDQLLGMNSLIANILSWIVTVLFAFLTNRKFVFVSDETAVRSSFWRQAFRFYAGRILTLIVEEGILFIFVTKMDCNSIAVKIISQIIVILLNYILSKKWIFEKQ